MTELVHSRCYSPGMYKAVEKWCEECCTLAKPEHPPKASTVANVLVNEWFCWFGVPVGVHSDQGQSFKGALIQQLCDLHGIQKTHTTPYHPQDTLTWVKRVHCTMLKPVLEVLPLYPSCADPESLQFENVGSEEMEDGQWIRVLQPAQTLPATVPVPVVFLPGQTDLVVGLLYPDGQREVSGQAADRLPSASTEASDSGEISLYRSARETTGRHSNPHHLPRAVGSSARVALSLFKVQG
ncbi:Pro-Pol polyprotein [Labeo rohita]|uniref:Pro-Pol polyprotein n=1 Tax=Labeo rohita TaxID=84645 RepID=A0ABQ8MGZ5_LABRO|nr:Pro-Pol polyprotein [Labeo rohita]